MKHTLHIQLRVCEGAVIRALGMIERRGFRLDAITMGEAQGDGQALQVVVTGDRSPNLLQRQLERLHDVSWVEQAQSVSEGTTGSSGSHNATMRPISGAR